MRKHVLSLSNQVQHKPCCTTTEDGQRLEILDLGSIRSVLSRVLYSCADTAQLI